MWRDLQYGFRQIRRNPLFATIVILLLAVGIGANTTIFSFVNTVLLRPLPVRTPENLHILEKMRVRQVRPDTEFFYRQFESISRNKTVFSGAAAEEAWWGDTYQPLSMGDSVHLITTQIVSPNYFSELGIKAIAGRVLSEQDGMASSEIPAVLSYQFWASEFNRSRGIIGRTIRIKNYPFLVVGVLPREFHDIEIEQTPDMRVPICAARVLTGNSVTEPGGEFPIRFEILTRLAPGASQAQSSAAISSTVHGMEEALWRDWNARSSRPWSREESESALKYETDYHLALADVSRGISQLRERFSRAVTLLMGAVGLLLLAVCANVAGLLLTRTEERKREITIRLSLGADRFHLLRQLFSENLLLALSGAGLGAALAYGAAPFLFKLLPTGRGGFYYARTPLVLDITPDAHVLLFAVAASLVTVILFGLAPASRALKIDMAEELKGSSRTTTAPFVGFAVTAVQVALAVVLLASASIMLRTFWNLEHLNPGFDRAHVLEFDIDPSDVGYSQSQAGVLRREIERRVRQIPGVRAVSFANMRLMRGIGMMTTVVPQGVILPKKTFLNTSVNGVTVGYFESLGIPLLAGRNLNASDVGHKPEPIVVNRAFADFFFPHESAIGKAIVTGTDGTKPPTAIIVGIVGTAKYRSMREDNPPIYYGIRDEKDAGGVMYVRAYRDAPQIINSVRGVLRQLAPNVPIVDVFTLEQEVQSSLWQERLITILFAFFGMSTLLLSGVGLYGALAYSIARRTRELGIRVAVGARARHIVQTVCSKLAVSVGLGLLAGLLCATVLMRLTAPVVFGVGPDDPMSFGIAAVVLSTCMLFAAAVPAWRAIKADPAVALRAE